MLSNLTLLFYVQTRFTSEIELVIIPKEFRFWNLNDSLHSSDGTFDSIFALHSIFFKFLKFISTCFSIITYRLVLVMHKQPFVLLAQHVLQLEQHGLLGQLLQLEQREQLVRSWKRLR